MTPMTQGCSRRGQQSAPPSEDIPKTGASLTPGRERAEAATWLVYVGPKTPIWSTKAMCKELIQKRKHSDWFVAFAAALEDIKQDATQSKMVAKIYVFLRDFIPRGLAGHLAHIRGDDVMEQLLCHPPETTFSRHRVGKYAENALASLEEWMRAGSNWQEALEHWKNEKGKKSANRKKVSVKAPGLHSPAGMLAALVLTHPETTLKDMIGRLEIQWMMTQDRGILDVSHGFWKGININNLFSVFMPSEVHEAEVPLQADYDRLLGPDFVCCRKDIRPFLPSWAKGIDLTAAPSDDEADVDGNDGSVPGGEGLRTPTRESVNASPSNGLARYLNLEQITVAAAPATQERPMSPSPAPSARPTSELPAAAAGRAKQATPAPVAGSVHGSVHQPAAAGSSQRTTPMHAPTPVPSLAPATAAPLATLDDFIGKKYSPDKHATSLGDGNGRPSKIPRLSLREELTASLDADRHRLREELGGQFRAERERSAAERDRLRAGPQDQAEGWQEQLRLAVDQRIGNLQGDWHALRGEIKADRDALRAELAEAVASLRSALEESGANTRADAAQAAATLRADVQAELLRSRENVGMTLQGLVDAWATAHKAPAPAPGQDGYLGTTCPAPPGWTNGQDGYEAQLERAAWSYIFILGNPDNGVAADEDAIKEVPPVTDQIKT